MHDLHGRLANRVQLTTDGLAWYRPAVEKAFRWGGVDFVQLVKVYAAGNEAEGRCSPAICIAAEQRWVMGNPDEDHVAAVDIHMMHYNFCRPHTTLTQAHPRRYPTTPAMASGVADHVWSVEEGCALLTPAS